MVVKRIYVAKNSLGVHTDFVKKNGNYYEVIVGYMDTKKELMKAAASYLKETEEKAKEWNAKIDTLICETKKGWCVAVYAPKHRVGIKRSR